MVASFPIPNRRGPFGRVCDNSIDFREPFDQALRCHTFPIPRSPEPITDGPMRIEQLEYIAAVNRHGSLRRAGEQLHVSQAALSEAIRKLEHELGVTLLDRHRSGARISAAGVELLQPIDDVLESVARLRAAAGDGLATRRQLRIGTVNAGTATLVLPAVRALQTQHPGSTVEIHNLQQHDIQLRLTEGTLDLGLVNLLDGDDVPPELESVTLLVGRPVVT
jgi:DNA-binding transcriptional LysR family regulator